MFLTLGTVRCNISIIKILPGYWDYINTAFLNEIYVPVMFTVPWWLLNSSYFGELDSLLLALVSLSLWWKVNLVMLITKLLDEY